MIYISLLKEHFLIHFPRVFQQYKNAPRARASDNSAVRFVWSLTQRKTNMKNPQTKSERDAVSFRLFASVLIPTATNTAQTS